MGFTASGSKRALELRGASATPVVMCNSTDKRTTISTRPRPLRRNAHVGVIFFPSLTIPYTINLRCAGHVVSRCDGRSAIAKRFTHENRQTQA